jgi:hypothetical protein
MKKNSIQGAKEVEEEIKKEKERRKNETRI